MKVAIGPGPGGCGNCGGELEELNAIEVRTGEPGSTLLLCAGCGIVVGRGDAATTTIRDAIADGRAKAIDAAPGFIAMRLLGGPST